MRPDLIVRRAAELIGWAGVAGVGLVMLTQAAGWTGISLIAVLQSLTPYGIPLVATVTSIGAWSRRRALAATAALVTVGALALSWPLISPPAQAEPSPDAVELRVAATNLLYSNPVVDEVADDLWIRDPDVIVFSEFTPEHARTLAEHPLSARYEHQLSRDGILARGMAVWSKLPMDSSRVWEGANSRTIDTMVDGPNGPIRLISVHPPTPIFDFDEWQRELERVGEAASSGRPTLAIGDFNASYWHPEFRDLLDRGFTDAHIALGSGWSTSWPTDEFLPPFVRLDHALTSGPLVATEIDDFRVPGSDHTGMIVTVTPSG